MKTYRKSMIVRINLSGVILSVFGLAIAVTGSQLAVHTNNNIIKLVGTGVDLAGVLLLIDGIVTGIRNMTDKRLTGDK